MKTIKFSSLLKQEDFRKKLSSIEQNNDHYELGSILTSLSPKRSNNFKPQYQINISPNKQREDTRNLQSKMFMPGLSNVKKVYLRKNPFSSPTNKNQRKPDQRKSTSKSCDYNIQQKNFTKGADSFDFYEEPQKRMNKQGKKPYIHTGLMNKA